MLLLLRAKGVPEHVPELGVCQIGETRTTHPFRAARMDLLDPTMLLESGNPRLFPWAVLMNSTDDQVRRIGRELAAIGDEESRGRFRMAATIRYDRNAVRRILGESDMGFLEVIKQGSFLCVEAREEGKAEGKAEGSVATARAMLRRYLKSKLPGLEAMPEIDAISSGPMLESLVDELVIESAGRARMRNAILSAARKG